MVFTSSSEQRNFLKNISVGYEELNKSKKTFLGF